MAEVFFSRLKKKNLYNSLPDQEPHLGGFKFNNQEKSSPEQIQRVYDKMKTTGTPQKQEDRIKGKYIQKSIQFCNKALDRRDRDQHITK